MDREAHKAGVQIHISDICLLTGHALVWLEDYIPAKLQPDFFSVRFKLYVLPDI
jgi:hypothetical protein